MTQAKIEEIKQSGSWYTFGGREGVLIDENARVLVGTRKADGSVAYNALKPMETAGGVAFYAFDDQPDGEYDTRRTYDDVYGNMNGEGEEIVASVVKNVENEEHTLFEFVTKMWLAGDIK